MHLSAHYGEALGLAAVAAEFGISPSYLSRAFARVTGLNFSSYLADLRVRRARELLAGGDLSVARIAEEVGFESLSSFGRAFRRLSGVSPLRYRAMSRRPKGAAPRALPPTPSATSPRGGRCGG